jgi:hypothetical protein
MGFETPNFETQEESYSSEEEAKKALETAIKMDDASKAEPALKAIEVLNQAKKDKLPEELLNAMKDATKDSDEVNFVRIKKDDILENFGKPESQENIGYEKVLVNGVETMLSKKISGLITYDEAWKWCENDNGRMPTIEELEALYKSDKADSFAGKVIWSSSMKYNSPLAFDFTDGKAKPRNKEDEVYATRAVADIH